MPNNSRAQVNHVAHKDSEDVQQRSNCRRTTWQLTNINLEQFVLDEGGNMMQSGKNSITTISGGSSSAQQQYRSDVENGNRPTTKRFTGGSTQSVAGEIVPESESCKINCGWMAATTVGFLCLLFVLCIYFIPSEGIFPVSVDLFAPIGHPLKKRGDIMVYPGIITEEAIRRHVSDSYIIRTDPNHFKSMADVLRNITAEYNRSTCSNELPEPYVNCYLENPNSRKPCFFEREWLGNDCVPETNFGYREIDGYINPCFLVRLKQTEDWYPINWSPSEVSDRYKTMYGSSFIGFVCNAQVMKNRNQVRFTQNPMKGFPQDFFPISRFKMEEYIYPAVMVQMHGLRVGQDIAITCRLRARNAYELRGSGSIDIAFQSASTQTENVNPSTLVSEKESSNSVQRT